MLRNSYMPSRAPQPKSGRDSPPTSPSVAECRLTAQNASVSAKRPTGWTRKGGGVGADSSTLNNCIVYFNAGANYPGGTLSYCCTTPDPGGIGDFTSAPLFVDQASGNLRLQ